MKRVNVNAAIGSTPQTAETAIKRKITNLKEDSLIRSFELMSKLRGIGSWVLSEQAISLCHIRTCPEGTRARLRCQFDMRPDIEYAESKCEIRGVSRAKALID